MNLITYLLRNRITPFNIKKLDYEPNLFDNLIKLNLDSDENVVHWILKRCGYEIFNIIYKIFLSTEENKELIIFYFFLNSLKFGSKVIYMRNKKCVVEALRISKYVGHEAHKLKGFLRFRELKNKVLYAEIEPTNDVLFMLSIHFKNRLKNEIWIIKDVRRSKYSVYDRKDFIIVAEDEFRLLSSDNSLGEEFYSDMWCEFYKTIGIEMRKNDKCRMNFMPKKYWKYITEVREEYEKNS